MMDNLCTECGNFFPPDRACPTCSMRLTIQARSNDISQVFKELLEIKKMLRLIIRQELTQEAQERGEYDCE